MINFINKYKYVYLLEKGNKEEKSFFTQFIVYIIIASPILVFYMSHIDYETKSNINVYSAFTWSTIIYVPIIIKNRMINISKYLYTKNFSESIFLYFKVYIGYMLFMLVMIITQKTMSNIDIVLGEMLIAFFLVNNFLNLAIPTLAKGRFNVKVSLLSLSLLLSLIPVILHFKENYFLEIALITNMVTLTVGILLTKYALRIKNYTK